MVKDDKIELFEIQVRGVLASAFTKSGCTPSKSQWGILRGADPMTMRDITEMGVDTNTLVSLLVDEKKQPAESNRPNHDQPTPHGDVVDRATGEPV